MLETAMNKDTDGMQDHATTTPSPNYLQDDVISEDSVTLLIIDDSVSNIRMLANILQDKASVLFATSGESGLQIARERHPMLILLDVEMPGMNGYEVCQALKSDDATRDCAVIFVTGHIDNASEIRALEAGAVDFLAKPLNPPVVRARVQTHLTQRQNAELLKTLASRDGLTGLYNRRYLDHQFAVEWRRHLREHKPIGLALIDIDHFKAYNDGYGHLEGDACLRLVAQTILQNTKRPGEVVARYGGEEFAVILPNTSLTDALKYGQRICEQVRRRQLQHKFSDTCEYVTISVGVTSISPEARQTSNEMYLQADAALYVAKRGGRNRATAYQPGSADGITL